MKIEKQQNGGHLTLSLEGRLDTTTAPALEAELKEALTGVTDLVFDFEQLEYVSSAGLRVLLMAYKTMKKQGHMALRHVNSVVMEVLEVTGFRDMLTIE